MNTIYFFDGQPPIEPRRHYCNAPDAHPGEPKLDHDDVIDLHKALENCETYDQVFKLATGHNLKIVSPREIAADYMKETQKIDTEDAQRYGMTVLRDAKLAFDGKEFTTTEGSELYFGKKKKPSWLERFRLWLRNYLLG